MVLDCRSCCAIWPQCQSLSAVAFEHLAMACVLSNLKSSKSELDLLANSRCSPPSCLPCDLICPSALQAWRLDTKGTDLRTTIVAFLIQFIRAEKNENRESVVAAYSSFFPRLLSAIEAGFDVSAAGSLSAYSNYSEAIDAMFMGATGKANLQSLFADDDLLQRTLRVLASIPAFPSHAIQFNLVLAANRVYRHAKKHAPAAASQMAKSKAVSEVVGVNAVERSAAAGSSSVGGLRAQTTRPKLGKSKCPPYADHRHHVPAAPRPIADNP